MTLEAVKYILNALESENSSTIDPTKLYRNLRDNSVSLYNIELMNTIEYLNSFCREDSSVQWWRSVCYKYIASLFDYRDFLSIFKGCNLLFTYYEFEKSFHRCYRYFTGLKEEMDIKDLIPSGENIKLFWKDCNPLHNYVLIADYLTNIETYEIPSLNRIEKLKILSDAIYLIQNNIYIGICTALNVSLSVYPKMNLRKGIGVHNFPKYINIYFPTFTRDNFAPGTTTPYWWECNDKASRLKALDKLIQITENENYNY